MLSKRLFQVTDTVVVLKTLLFIPSADIRVVSTYNFKSSYVKWYISPHLPSVLTSLNMFLDSLYVSRFIVMKIIACQSLKIRLFHK